MALHMFFFLKLSLNQLHKCYITYNYVQIAAYIAPFRFQVQNYITYDKYPQCAY